jgi:putative ATP-dependent endonuclease of the OLD family
VPIDNLTAILGRNDVGKSTILEALEIFFNQEIIKIEPADKCVHGVGDTVQIACVFEDLPEQLTIDARAPTSLANEYLVNPDGYLEIVKQYNCSLKSPKESVWALANHPSIDGAHDLLALKNEDLKARAAQLEVPLVGVDQRSNVQLRNAIRAHLGNLMLTTQVVSLADEDGKKVWDKLKSEMPVYALFQADRPSRDDDPEVSDPMKIAVQSALLAVQPQLDAIKEQVRGHALEVASRTLAKLAEMDPLLAGQLTPNFKAEPKWDGFKLSLSGDNDIPINKRGSGVRRLIPLNFFRAEAERRREAALSQQIIYAIEEPESSQHPDNQAMLMKALLGLSEAPGTQVLITTHVPNVAAQIPAESVRLLTRGHDGYPMVGMGQDDIYDQAVATLGVLPDKRAQVVVYLEGPNDHDFLIRVSRLCRTADASLPDLDNDYRIAFVMTGGGNLKHWVNKRYLANAGLIEVHIYDADDPAAPPYQAQIDTVNGRGTRDIAFLTQKRETENYIHTDAIHSVYGFHILTADWADIPTLVAEQVHIASGATTPWQNLTDDKRSKKVSNAKRRLNTDVADRLTLAQQWLRAVRDRIV